MINIDLILIEMLSSDNEYENEIASKVKTYKTLFDRKQISGEEFKDFVNATDAEIKISRAVMEPDSKEKINSMLTALNSAASIFV